METSKTREARFLKNEAPNAYALYQLKKGPTTRLHRHMSLSILKSEGLTVSKSNYECVYTGEQQNAEHRSVTTRLEMLFHQFNMGQPLDYTGQSASVSDVFAIKVDGKIAFYYADAVGFKELPDFQNKQEA